MIQVGRYATRRHRRSSSKFKTETGTVPSLILEEGRGEHVYNTPFLRKIRRGVKNVLPGRADRRGALLLLLLVGHAAFCREKDQLGSLLSFGTIMGFMAMLRPHRFEQLNPASFTIVTWTGRCYPMPRGKRVFSKPYRTCGANTDYLDSSSISRAKPC